jgi:hypothetical protein
MIQVYCNEFVPLKYRPSVIESIEFILRAQQRWPRGKSAAFIVAQNELQGDKLTSQSLLFPGSQPPEVCIEPQYTKKLPGALVPWRR